MDAAANQHKIASFAERIVSLAEAHKEDMATIVDQAKAADLDTSALKRLASWKRKDATKRAESEAIDHQYRFLAGEVPEPATLPPDCELATAIRLFREGMTVRDVAKEMEIAVGKAHKLKTQAAAFSGVHVHLNVNADPETGELPRDMVEGDLGEWIAETPVAVPAGNDGASAVTSGFRPVAASTWAFITAPVLAQLAAEEAERAVKEAIREGKRAERAALAERNRRIDADTLDFPPHLRRSPAQGHAG